jgi:hypothetical protein
MVNPNVPRRQSPKVADATLGRIHRNNAGKPVHAVRRNLQSDFRRLGWQADAATMRNYAEQISAGHEIRLDPRRVRY